MKIRKIFKRAATAAMAAVTALSVVPSSTALAAGDIGTISFANVYDGAGNAMRYNSSANIGGYTAGGTGEYKYRMYVDGENAFCIQPGVPLRTGNTLAKASSHAWNSLSANQRKAVGLALLYGYQGNRNNLSGSDDEKWLATQTLVWEFVTGCREATGSYNQSDSTIYNLHFGSNYSNSGARAAYEQIVAMLTKHNKIPSFMSGSKDGVTKELSYKDGKYSITFTDGNGVLSEYNFISSDSNVKVAKSGNKLTITSVKAVKGSVRITASRNNTPTVSGSAKMIAYGDPNLQDLITGVENVSNVAAYINVETPTGTIALKKTSEDGVVQGISFIIKGDNFNKTVKTDKDGNMIVEDLFPGTYTVTEQVIDRYEPQKTQTITVIGGKTSTVTFSNTLKRGSLEVVKTSEDNLAEDVKFHLYGTSLSGLAVDEYAVTDKDGLAKFENILISGNIGADKYEVIAFDENAVSLRNAEFPLFGKEFSREDFEQKLKENPANDHLKMVITESQETGTLTEEKPDSIALSIGFSEHPAFYDRELNDRFTDLSFALGNKLLGVLDEKQHRERENEDNHVGWYHKTDFEIHAVIGGEEFNYEGRFDIGDGEGDLIAHIRNFYEYSLSPACPFIPEWKRQGEDYYREKIESLRLGCDVLIPFLEQYTELTLEDEKRLDEIMATADDWFYRVKEPTEEEQLEPFYREESVKPAPSGADGKQDNSDLIGREISIDNRRYLIESIGKISGDVSMRDITFQNDVGFPINRVEKVSYVRSLLEQTQTELPSEEKMEAPTTAKPSVPTAFTDRYNYRIINDDLGVGGAKEKFRNNLSAINLLHNLQIENRLATPEEQETLAKYVGWGGLSMAFDEKNAAWTNEYKELKSVLSDEEYRAAMESTLTAFYTPPIVIKAMYEALDRLGFSQGNILEPSCGTGNFLGLLPDSMEKSKLYGIEIDPLSGRIAKQLYQKASIAIEGFEDTKLPDNHFDVVLGNIPFGEFKVNDSRYNAQKFLIHDYFIAKALDKVRAGGVVMFITSKGTMDKTSPEVRRYIARRAELLGAIRLPDSTFRANAGTEVTSDILILQKRDRLIDVEPDWIFLDTDVSGITMNSYFVNHPEMVLGEMKMESTLFGMDAVCKAHQDIPLSELLHGAVRRINGEITELDDEIDRISDEQNVSIEADPEVRNFSFTLVEDKVYFRENDRMNLADVSVTAENRIKGLVQIRDCVRRLIQYQTDDCPEEMIQSEQKNLNNLYDAFTKKYGLINNRGNYLAFAADESYFLLCSLEVLDDEGKFKRKADMFTKRTIKPHREVTFVETASEALALSIGEKARVDLEYMAQLTGKTQEKIIEDLRGIIFKIPNTEPVKYVTADEYLSGNVRAKLITAKTAAKENPEYAVNVEALQKVIPKDLPASEISIRLGTAWIPEEDIQQFVIELLTPSSHAAGRIRVRYTAINGEWFIENKNSDFGNVKADSTYGTKRASAYRIIEDTLNLRDTRIFDYVYDEHGNKKAVFNVKETTAAQAKQEIIKQAFQDWIWKDPERRTRLVRYYNDTFNSVRPREYDGSHITFGGISPEITLRPHQVNAIAHILYGGNTLLAHKVGAGKTFEMVAAAQESKRLGLCQKSMFVVPNHLVGQWASEYLRLYPSANILVARKQDFETANRKKFCGRIATGAYDAVIIGHSQFEKIPISEERQREQLMRQLDDIEHGIDDVQATNGEQFTVKQLMKTRKAIKAKLDKLNDMKRKDNVINFEELGVDRLFIDESHFYKNLYLYTKMRNVGGIAQTEAQKSSDLFMKCRYLDEITGNRGTVFATGTPVSNSMVELYSVQRYLQYDTLVRNGLQHFDSWASTFGETVTALEIAPKLEVHKQIQGEIR